MDACGGDSSPYFEYLILPLRRNNQMHKKIQYLEKYWKTLIKCAAGDSNPDRYQKNKKNKEEIGSVP